MKRFFILTGILFLLIKTGTGFAQTVPIPDVNFRNKLISSYPFVMSANQQLNINAAAVFGPDLIVTNCNISDLTGVEYFKSIYKLDASGNNLTTIPALTGFTNIQYLYLNDNKLTSLPPVSSLTTLTQLQCHDNLLTSIPSLTGLTGLQNLYVAANNLSALPDLSGLPNLRYLYTYGNPRLTSLNVSSNTNLLELYCYEDSLTAIQGLSNLTSLKKIYCSGNHITDLSGLSNNTVLTVLSANNNDLETLPGLLNKPNLSELRIHSNRLTFEDLLPLASISGLSSFVYAPQDSIGLTSSISVRATDPIVLTVSEDASISTNLYKWYKSSVLLDANQSGSYTITSSVASDAGTYYSTVTNTALPLLTLYHRAWQVQMLPCMELTSYSITIPTNECKGGAAVSVSNIVISGSSAPLRYYLVSASETDSIKSSNPDFINIAAGNYTFLIADADNCYVSTPLTVSQPKNCDPVISPSSGPSMSSFFIEEAGTVKIIDLEGNVIKQLNAPAVWDGTTSDGTLANTGYYVIILNNKKLTNITVIR